jgi:glycosyltransferase involved in cell wall biosynthesis
VDFSKLRSLFKLDFNRKQNSVITHLNSINDNNIKQTQNSPIKGIDRKLWGGYSPYALEELKRVKNSSESPLDDRVRAARCLSRWYYEVQDFEKAYEELEFINKIKPVKKPGFNRVVLEIKVLKKLGERNIAKEKVWKAIDNLGLQSTLCLSMAHLALRENEKLSWYNLIYDKYGYQPIEKLDESKQLNLENITTSPTTSYNKDDLEKYKVSIIIPTFNAADTIHIALESLMNQTMRNLEILVVDDCSTDNTAEVVENYAARDRRIKLIVKEKNEGAYMARNKGLQYVTGDFITVHDSDDWSHSEKIEKQLLALLKDTKKVGSISYWVRVSDDLTPLNPNPLLNPKFLIMNSSSLLIRKEVFEKLGGWDSVRVAGDTEFIYRIMKAFGEDSIVHVEPEVPLSLSLSTEGSLTNASITSIKTVRFGLRRTYEDAFRWWHEQINSVDELYLDPKRENRPFPCPVPNRIQKDIERNYDTILIADFSEKSLIDICISLMEKLIAKSKRVGIFHWPHYEGDPSRTVDVKIFDFILKNSIDILVPDEVLNTEKIFILTPKILDYALDKAPKVMYKRAYVADEQDLKQEQRLIRSRNLEKTLNISAEWLPLSELQIIISE